MSAAVHAPTSGTVLAIEEHLAAHPSGLTTLTVIIEPDGRDEWIVRTPFDYRALAPERVRELLRDAGVCCATPASSASVAPSFRVTPSSPPPGRCRWTNW